MDKQPLVERLQVSAVQAHVVVLLQTRRVSLIVDATTVRGYGAVFYRNSHNLINVSAP